MSTQVLSPFPLFTSITGAPLNLGYVYIGIEDQDPETNPKQAYWDAALAIPAAQPLRTDGGYIVNAGNPNAVYVDGAFSIRVRDKNGVQVFYRASVADADSLREQLASGNGSSLVGYLDPGFGAVTHNLETLLDNSGFINVFRFFTDAQIAAVTAYNGAGPDVTTALQNALNAAWGSNRDLYTPAGLYRVTNLVMPGGAAARTKAFRWYGQGAGELFARALTGGTIIQQIGSSTQLLLLDQDAGNPSAGNGNQEIAYIRFEGNATTAVIDAETLYAQSEIHHCGVYNANVGDGIRIRHANTVEVHHNYILNRDWFTPPVSRVGIGIHCTTTNDNGLLTLRKNTSRGFEWGYKLGGAGGVFYSPMIQSCEGSNNDSGIWLTSACRNATVIGNYLEGGDGGTGILDEGNSNVVFSNNIFPGYAVGIDSSSANVGSNYNANTIGLGATVNAIALKLSGGETMLGNYIARTQGTNGQVGIQITGSSPKIYETGTTFEPSVAWTGTGAKKIDDQSTGGGVIGLLTKIVGDLEIPGLSRGYCSPAGQVLGDSAVSAGVLTIPPGDMFEVTFTSATAVTSIDGGGEEWRKVTLIDTNGNFDLADGGPVVLAGNAPFSGFGSISLVLKRVASTTTAYEECRAIY